MAYSSYLCIAWAFIAIHTQQMVFLWSFSSPFFFSFLPRFGVRRQLGRLLQRITMLLLSSRNIYNHPNGGLYVLTIATNDGLTIACVILPFR